MIVDSHQHFLDPARYHYPWLDGRSARINRSFAPDDLEPLLERTGVASTVVVQTLHDEAETLGLLALSEQAPWIGAVVGWVDLTRADVGDALARLLAAPGGSQLRGIRHLVHEEANPDWLDQADVRSGLSTLSRYGLIFDLLLRPRELAAAGRTVRAIPELLFVVDHIAKPRIAAGWPDPDWAAGLAELARATNVVCKLSGLVTEDAWDTWSTNKIRPFAEHALACFGPQRMMFGSDWPVCELAATYDAVLEAADALTQGLDHAGQSAFFTGTATATYRLSAGIDVRA